MRAIIGLIFLASVSISGALLAGEVKKGNEGMYWATYNSITNNRVTYQVDTKAQLCFILFRGGNGGGITMADCKDFAKRDEWKKIINWVK